MTVVELRDGVKVVMNSLTVGDVANDLPYGCEKCDGFGNVIDESGARFCECKLEYFARKSRRRAKIPPNMAGKTFENFERSTKEARMAFNLAEKWEESYPNLKKPGLFIHGVSGTGKSHLAAGICDRLLKRRVSVLWIDYSDVFDFLMEGHGETGDRSLAGISSGFSVAVIDDLGFGRVTPYRLDEVAKCFASRYRRGAATIITTNLSLHGGDFRTAFGEPMESRIVGFCTMIYSGDQDRRRPNK